MPPTDQPGSPSPALTCGNCGKPVAATEVICPSCGVLLAAYQAPAGAAAAVTPVSFPTYEPPSPPVTATEPDAANAPPQVSSPAVDPSPAPPAPPPTHAPRSQSPIGDALRRSAETGIGRGGEDTGGHARYMDEIARMSRPADELASMADGTDELADMADGADELADMAGGNDELADMAAGGHTTLAQQVEAQLTGARVRFDGPEPVIDVEIEKEPRTAAPDATPPAHAATAAPLTTPAKPAAPPATTASTARPGLDSRPPIAWVGEAQPADKATTPERRSVYGRPVTDWGGADPTPARRAIPALPWVPIVIAVCLILGMARAIPAAGGIMGFLLVIALVWGLLKWTSATSRKTTSMPKDADWNKRKPRF